MGIKGLNQFLKKKFPELFQQIHLNEFNGDRIAIDTSIFLYKFIGRANAGKGNWIDMFINDILGLRKYNIRPLFVFDGQAPIEKQRTQKTRRADKYKIEQQLNNLEEIITEINKLSITEELSEPLLTRVLEIFPHENVINQPIRYIKFQLNAKFKKLNAQNIKVSPEDIEKIKNILTLMGLPWIQAPGEAEKYCTWLVVNNFAKGVYTIDSDVLAYGCPVFIQNINFNNGICDVLYFSTVLEKLQLTKDSFIDFCIMCGTDYNNNIPGIGPVKAYNLIKKYGCINKISQTHIDTSLLYFHDSRRLFTLDPPPSLPSSENNEYNSTDNNSTDNNSTDKFITNFIPRVQKIQTDELKQYLFKINSRYQHSKEFKKLVQNIVPPKPVFVVVD